MTASAEELATTEPARTRRHSTERDDRQRIGPLDGVRGLAIVLVVLSHGWALWPEKPLQRLGPFQGLFFTGNLGVTIFFVVGGFVVARGLLVQAALGSGPSPFRFYARRLIRIGVQLYPLLLVVLLLSVVDRSDPSSGATTRASLVTVATHTWNVYLLRHAAESRPDLGHLWYLSVEQQGYLFLAPALLAFGQFRRLFIGTLGVTVVAIIIWRDHSLHVEGWWIAALRTSTRIDALLLGVLAALAAGYFRRFRRLAPLLLLASSITMVVVILTATKQKDLEFLGAKGLIFELAATIFVIMAVNSPEGNWLLRALGRRSLRRLGEASLAIYLWHYPLFWLVSRHTHGWNWPLRTALTFGLLVAIVIACQRFIDAPSKRWLASHLRPSPLARPAPDDRLGEVASLA